LRSLGEDPYIVFQVDAETTYSPFEKKLENRNMVTRLALVALIDIIVVLALVHLREYTAIPLEIVRNKKLIVNLAKNDFKTRFAGSYLGTIWAFVQPIVTVLVYWFVFEKGLRAGRVSEYPYVLWLMAGLIPWFYFSEAWNGGTNSLLEYNYLVKKVVFHISILPVVKVVSSLFAHLFFTVFVFVLCWCYGYAPDLYSLQLFYYILANFVLVLGLSYLTASIVCFFKDMTQIINIVLQVGIWMTPIMWQTSILPSVLAKIFKLNPVYYIVEGFRDALLEKQWFWNDMAWTIYFWIFVIALFLLGTRIFQKLKVHFADVL
jgi:teichoic acid transport system permease protein